ncbi:MAG TPA: hypothetical protein VNR39_16155 [Pseudolabrys sp.]|nr:hypothetical protein [Pseudolabrys sp.]
MNIIPLRKHPAAKPHPAADPNAIPVLPRPRNAQGKGKGQASRRPHGDATVAAVRELIEETTFTYNEISARTGVGRASISRWARDLNWTRPLDAPRSTDRMPRYRLSQKLKLRLLAERLRRLAERHIDELEKAPQVDPDKLIAALEVLKMTRLHIQGRRRHAARRDVWGKLMTGRQWLDEREAMRRALRELKKGGVNVDLAPNEAIDLYVAAHTPPDDNPAFRARGKRKS